MGMTHAHPSQFFRTVRSISTTFSTSSRISTALKPLVHHSNRRTMASAMGRRLEGKTVIVTGASSGIGKSTALEFARTSPKNLKLVLTARRIDALKQLAEEIKKDDMGSMIDTNITGLVNMTQACLKVMKGRGESGQGDIINIGSIAGREGYPGGAIYCATKAAVRSFTEAMRKELIASRIRVIEIDPGQVETEFSVVRFYGDKEKADAVYKGVTPLTPDDIAETIVFAAGRPENVVIADMLVFPNHQAAATVMHRRS